MENADICPECGDCESSRRHRLIFYRQGSSQGYYCHNAKCEYGFATTYIPKIQQDETVYSLYITFLGDNWKQAIVFLSLRFNLGIHTARKFKKFRKLLSSGSAAEIFKVREELNAKNILVEIEPEYKYDVWDDKPQGEFEIE